MPAMAERYRKKPVDIEAMRLTTESLYSVAQWCNGEIWGDSVVIKTLEGDMRAEQGDWVIKGVKGEFYPCKPDIFEATYDKVVNHD